MFGRMKFCRFWGKRDPGKQCFWNVLPDFTEPDLLLLDEPFSALDPVTKQKMYEVLWQIRQNYRCTIVFVSHDFEEARQLSDRTGIMICGKLCGVVDSRYLYTVEWNSEVKEFLGITNSNT